MSQLTTARRFVVQRNTDPTGVSGLGVVLDGILWPDGTVSVRWRGDQPSTVFWNSIDDAEAKHCYGGHSSIVWVDEPSPPAGERWLAPRGAWVADGFAEAAAASAANRLRRDAVGTAELAEPVISGAPPVDDGLNPAYPVTTPSPSPDAR